MEDAVVKLQQTVGALQKEVTRLSGSCPHHPNKLPSN